MRGPGILTIALSIIAVCMMANAGIHYARSRDWRQSLLAGIMGAAGAGAVVCLLGIVGIIAAMSRL